MQARPGQTTSAPHALLYSALHSILYARSLSSFQALAGGWGPRIESAVKAAGPGN
jgi:hypothetical protein